MMAPAPTRAISTGFCAIRDRSSLGRPADTTTLTSGRAAIRFSFPQTRQTVVGLDLEIDLRKAVLMHLLVQAGIVWETSSCSEFSRS